LVWKLKFGIQVDTSCSIGTSYNRLLSVLEEQPAWKIAATPKG